MVLALLVTTLGFATLIFVQEAKSPPLVYGAYYAGTLFALYVGVRLLLPHSDVLLLPIVTLLTGLGLVMVFRLTYDVKGAETLALTQAVWILVGSGTMFLLVLFFRNYDRLFDYKYLLAIFAVFLIASTFTPLGYTVNGARLWVDLGPVGFQPSEFARIALVVFFAVPLLMLYVATGRIAYILLGGVLFCFGSFATFLLFEHVQVRVQSWIDP